MNKLLNNFLSIIHISFSLVLVFFLSGCMEDNNNLNYLIAGAAGGTVASMVGYGMSKPSMSKIAQAKNKIACCCSR